MMPLIRGIIIIYTTDIQHITLHKKIHTRNSQSKLTRQQTDKHNNKQRPQNKTAKHSNKTRKRNNGIEQKNTQTNQDNGTPHTQKNNRPNTPRGCRASAESPHVEKFLSFSECFSAKNSNFVCYMYHA